MKRELEHELRGRRDSQVAPTHTTAAVEMLFELVKDLVGIQSQLGHYLSEGVPLNLRECQEDVLVRQLDVIAAPRFLNGAVHDALGRFSNLARCDIEVVHGPILQVQALRPVLTRSKARCDPARPGPFWGEIYEQNKLVRQFRGRDTESWTRRGLS